MDYNNVSPYKYELSKWQKLYDMFIRGNLDSDEKWDEILELEKSSNIPKYKSKCGGEFSMVAKPRCSVCKTIDFNSIFRVCDNYHA